jgi:UDP-glucose 4-epimerase
VSEPAQRRAFVVGGAGFIGSHLVDALVARGPVTIYDDLSVGRAEFVAPHLAAGRARLVTADALDLGALTAAMRGHDVVFHLAANPEARHGLERTRLDLEQGTIATYNVLEAMRASGTSRLVFASSGTVYGEAEGPCAEEDLGRLPISLYGASKLAGEAMISAFVECFGLRATILRFGNVVGPRGTHGAALDFLRKLRERGDELEVLGDGRQSKPYLHVRDCVAGLLFALDHGALPLGVYNLAPADATSVMRIAELCVRCSPHPNARIRLTGGDRGWPGDVPRSRLRPDKLAALGFRVRMTSDEAVASAVRALAREVFPELPPQGERDEVG